MWRMSNTDQEGHAGLLPPGKSSKSEREGRGERINAIDRIEVSVAL